MSGWMPISRSSLTECCVGLVFSSSRRLDVRHEREVHVDGVAAADFLPELADRFEERQRFDVADRAADLDDHDVDVLRSTSRMHFLISSVMCGMTCTVLPR